MDYVPLASTYPSRPPFVSDSAFTFARASNFLPVFLPQFGSYGGQLWVMRPSYPSFTEEEARRIIEQKQCTGSTPTSAKPTSSTISKPVVFPSFSRFFETSSHPHSLPSPLSSTSSHRTTPTSSIIAGVVKDSSKVVTGDSVIPPSVLNSVQTVGTTIVVGTDGETCCGSDTPASDFTEGCNEEKERAVVDVAASIDQSGSIEMEVTATIEDKVLPVEFIDDLPTSIDELRVVQQICDNLATSRVVETSTVSTDIISAEPSVVVELITSNAEVKSKVDTEPISKMLTSVNTDTEDPTKIESNDSVLLGFSKKRKHTVNASDEIYLYDFSDVDFECPTSSKRAKLITGNKFPKTSSSTTSSDANIFGIESLSFHDVSLHQSPVLSQGARCGFELRFQSCPRDVTITSGFLAKSSRSRRTKNDVPMTSEEIRDGFKLLCSSNHLLEQCMSHCKALLRPYMNMLTRRKNSNNVPLFVSEISLWAGLGANKLLEEEFLEMSVSQGFIVIPFEIRLEPTVIADCCNADVVFRRYGIPPIM